MKKAAPEPERPFSLGPFTRIHLDVILALLQIHSEPLRLVIGESR